MLGKNPNETMSNTPRSPGDPQLPLVRELDFDSSWRPNRFGGCYTSEVSDRCGSARKSPGKNARRAAVEG